MQKVLEAGITDHRRKDTCQMLIGAMQEGHGALCVKSLYKSLFPNHSNSHTQISLSSHFCLKNHTKNLENFLFIYLIII